MDSIVNAQPFKPQALIDFLKSEAQLSDLFRGPGSVFRQFSLEEHTLAVMNQFEKYFVRYGYFAGANAAFYRTLLALHDIGKPRAIEAGYKGLQHNHTLDILKAIKHLIALPDDRLILIELMLEADPLGMWLQQKMSKVEAQTMIRRHANHARTTIEHYLSTLTIYYQCDVAGYTSSAPFMKALDYLFEWEAEGQIRICHDRKRLLFSKSIEERYVELQTDL